VCVVENNSAVAVYDVEIPRTTLPVYELATITPWAARPRRWWGTAVRRVFDRK
jgi:hypothetical protein